MYFTQLAALASSAAIVAAAPAPIPVGKDDVILYGSGRYQLMKRSNLEELEGLRQNGIVPPKPAYLDTMYHGPTANDTDGEVVPLSKREGVQLIIPNPHSRFVGWDVQMSEVVKGAPTTIAVGTGYSIANTLSVGTSSTFSLVEDFLSTSVSIDYSTSWTTSQTQTFTAKVEAGKYGAFVSNPWTNRESGNVFEGTIGQEGSLTYYQADSFENKQFGDMTWVDGVISLCQGDAFPLPRCIGEGTL